MDADLEEFKREGLQRWLAAKPKRRELALQIMRGEREYAETWPQWVVYDIKAEIALIERERKEAFDEAERTKKERASREAQKDLFR